MADTRRKPRPHDPTVQAVAGQSPSDTRAFFIALRDLSIALLIMLVGLAVCSIADHQGRIGQHEATITGQRVAMANSQPAPNEILVVHQFWDAQNNRVVQVPFWVGLR